MASSVQTVGVSPNNARQKEVKRITSNLPEVYNRYFFTVGSESKAAVDPMG